MLKIKKIHKIIVFFILIFLLGVYTLSLYIENTIDQKSEINTQKEIDQKGNTDREATKVN
ncbi:hypothetical protein ACFSTE_00035 [Aquimarina hainanensis]|uniref:Uncharacterized protein n=1 Tax=Aquimarina hainanensis TaxID=1578017 RepID=A0ABW5N2A6_9FLAO|nr:hypothetical protein [Aquimarina sp. TRL1]QKX04678.1 hypothetical protein HN014_07045 [Aquimarina sp. TRL1]